MQEGDETSGQTKYGYKFFSDSWFCRYQVIVPGSFLDVPGRELCTKEFEVGGHAWSIRLVSGQDGKLGAFLRSQNQAIMDVHLAFTLVNRDDQQKNVTKGDLYKFHPDTSLGYSDLASIATIKNGGLGYLQGGDFVVILEMRLKREENEHFHSHSENNRRCIWELKNVAEMSPSVMKTEEFKVGDHKWQLLFHPYGKGPESTHLSFFVRSCNQFAVSAKVVISIENQGPMENASKEFACTFSQCSTEHGCSEFLEIDQLKDKTHAFQKDGWMVLTAQIFVQDPQVGLKPQQQTSVQEIQNGHDEDGPTPSTEQDRSATLPADMAFHSNRPNLSPLEQSASFDGWGFNRDFDPNAYEDTASQQMTAPSIIGGTEDSLIEFDHQSSRFARSTPIVPGSKFAGRYWIEDKPITNKPDALFATDELSGEDAVLKFYCARDYERCLKICKALSAEYVCKVTDFINDDRLGVPPCLVFENGSYTLDEWIRTGSREPSERKDAMFQVLHCLRYIHSYDIVHGDINPNSIAYFPSSRSWKLLNTDAGVKEGEPCGPGYTLEYAAPERIQAEESQTTLKSAKSMDMFSFGILAFELWTGTRFYGRGATKDVVTDWLLIKRELPNMEHVENGRISEWLCSLLCFEPAMRLTAQIANNYVACGAADFSNQQTAKNVRRVADCHIDEKPMKQWRGYEVTATQLQNLTVGKEVGSSVFESWGQKWRICLVLHKPQAHESVKVLLVSCNPECICGHVGLAVQLNNRQVPDRCYGRVWTAAEPFGIMDCRDIRKDDLTNSRGFQPDDKLVIKVEFRDVKEATKADKKAVGKQGINPSTLAKTLKLEIIETRSILTYLNNLNAFGLASSQREWDSDLNGCSLVLPWAVQSANVRYWLCRRNEEGGVYVVRSLNEVPLLQRFDHLREDHGGGLPWVTLFKEESEGGKRMESVDETTLVVFCKRFDDPDDLIYVEHRMVPRKMRCSDLLLQLAADAGFHDTDPYSAYLEIPGHELQDITFKDDPLPTQTNGISYVIILTKRDETRNKEESKEIVQKKLRELHRSGQHKRREQQPFR